MQIQVTPGSPQSIHRQIMDQVRRQVTTGKAPVGAAMPSVRQLAKELVINPNTVAKAYAELVRDGVLESLAGKGFFVARRKNIYSRAERLRRLDVALDSLISEALTLDFGSEELIERLQKRLSRLVPETTPETGARHDV